MKSHPYYIVDVFAESKFSGNQLAVVLNANDLSTQQMQTIAREMNFSETSFILYDTPGENGWDVRIYTPTAEVPFAGHPTLGTSFIITKKILQKDIPQLILNLKVGQIPVFFSTINNRQMIWMKQVQPTFGKEYSANQLAHVLSIDIEQIDDKYPILEVSTGLPFILVPLKSLDAVKGCVVNHQAHLSLVANSDVKDIMVFCPETYSRNNQVNARVFVDFLGIPEDPATGSANGCLAAYLVKFKYFHQSSIDIRVEQGYEIHRPSILHLQASLAERKYDINVGGEVVMVAEGNLL